MCNFIERVICNIILHGLIAAFLRLRLFFEPVRDELPVDVNIDLFELAVAFVHEFMRHFCRDDDHLPGMGFQGFGSHCKSGNAFLYDENFFVGMFVQADNATGRHVHPDEGEFGVLIPKSFELIGIPIAGKFVSVEKGIVHVKPRLGGIIL